MCDLSLGQTSLSLVIQTNDSSYVTLSLGGTTMPSFSLLYLRLRVQKHTSNSIFIECLLHALVFINNIVNINNYSSAMRRLCLSEFRLVALFCCNISPWCHHLPYTTPTTKTNDNMSNVHR